MTLKRVGKKKQCIGIRFLPQEFYCFLTCSKLAKWLTNMTCSKLTKWLIIMTCSKLAVLNKAIQGTFLSLKKVKIDPKDTDCYFLERSSGKWSDPRHFFKSQKGKKKVYGNSGSIFACDLEKYPRLLYFPLLIVTNPSFWIYLLSWQIM